MFWEDPNGWGPAFQTAFRRGRFFGAGELRLALLSMLGERPKHGYELMKELESRSGGSYRVSAGALYPTLQLLEDEGMVISRQDQGRRVYELTEAGRAEIAGQSPAIEDIWRKTSHWGDWGPWAAGPFGALAKAAFQAVRRAGADKDKKARVEAILDQARRDLDSI